MQERTVSVPAIHCAHCVRTIEQELGELPGVESVSASATNQTVTLVWTEPATFEKIVELLVELGYPPAP
jgi:copper chaperone CopZ